MYYDQLHLRCEDLFFFKRPNLLLSCSHFILSKFLMVVPPCDSSIWQLNLQVLVGIGFKGMRIMRVKNLNLYAFGLCEYTISEVFCCLGVHYHMNIIVCWIFHIDMQPNTICEKLGPKYASVPTTKLMDSPDFYNDLLGYLFYYQYFFEVYFW
jgi:hypothetical protein